MIRRKLIAHNIETVAPESAEDMLIRPDEDIERTVARLRRAGVPGSVRSLRELLAAGAQGTEFKEYFAARPMPEISMPEMVQVSDKLAIMKKELTVGLFKQVMEGYEITGHNADKLKAILADTRKEDNALTYVNLLDAREFAKRLSNLTGRKFRVQTEAEWLAARDKLSGNYWTWTETKYDNNTCVLRHLRNVNRGSNFLENRYGVYSVRFVEDL